MELLSVMVILLWVVVLLLIVAFIAMSRQVGILFERVTPLGALTNDAGPMVGEAAPVFHLPSLTGGDVVIGSKRDRSTLLFFLSPTCPVCKKLLPILRSISQSESDWLDLVLASDGDPEKHKRFIETAQLGDFPYVNSTELGMTYRVSRLPLAVLIDGTGVIRSKGLVNNREQVESLFNAKEMGVESVQDYLDKYTPAGAL